MTVESAGQQELIQYWKVAPGDGGSEWEPCRDGGMIAVGWSELGDLSLIAQEEFNRRAKALLAEHSTWGRKGILQAWAFSRIPAGSLIVANRGTTEVLGIGRVTGPYYFAQGHYGHRLPVEWTDLRLRAVEQPGWRRTLVRLTEETFKEILAAEELPEEEPEEPGETVPATDLRGYQTSLLELLSKGTSEKGELFEKLHLTLANRLLPGDERTMVKGAVVWRDRASWALTYLKRDGLVRNPKSGFWEITEQGLERLKKPAATIADYQKSQVTVRLTSATASAPPPIKVVVSEQPRIRFKEARHDVDGLLKDIERGDIALPDIQRPFVWKASKVRDLFDSMYRGFPVGSLMLWSTLDNNNTKNIGLEPKQRTASQLVIDGQQRLTSLYSVIRGKAVLDENYEELRLEIAFRPGDGRFDVADAAIRKDPEFVSSISDLWTSNKPSYRLIKEFVDNLKTKRTLTPADEDAVSGNLSRVLDLTKYPFTTLEIDRDVDDEAVADIFVRINNGGSKLGQSDFILTLLSVFSMETRRALEAFAKNASAPPNQGEPSPFNHLMEPKPAQMLRVAIALGFHRARLSAVYQLLRGKDPDTGNISPTVREKQFEQLREAVGEVLDLTHWHLFLGCITGAGFRSAALISSETALLYSYALYLIGKIQCGVEEKPLGRLIARWFFAASLSSRYSGSSETAMEEDLSLVRELHEPDSFVRALEAAMESVVTNDFWEVTVPQALETSSINSPTARAYLAAQIKLGAPVLFSDKQMAYLYDPLLQAKRKAIEGHHLFPKAWLRSIGITDLKQVNQAANLAHVEWPDNSEMSDLPPAQYVPVLVPQFSVEGWDAMCAIHALPSGWERLAYAEFLGQRRRLMARIIRSGFDALGSKELRSIDVRQIAGADERATWSLIEEVEVELRKLIRRKYADRWGEGAESRVRKVFSEKEIADCEARRAKHLDAYPLSPGQIPPADFLDYMYLGDLARLVTAAETWDQFSPQFDRRKDVLQGKLQQILPVRNDRAHFRPVPENELLRCKLACSDLLSMFKK